MSAVPSEISKYMGNAVKLADIWGSIIYNVKAYGARGNGVKDDTVAIQKAIDAASEAGGGTVFLLPGNYYTTGVLNLPSSVKLLSFSDTRDGNSNDQINNGGATIFITNTVSPFITIAGQNCSIDGITFFYPNQANGNASSPVVYPYTIKQAQSGGPGTNLSNLTFVNSYQGIDISAGATGRTKLENIWMGSLLMGINIDYAFDVVHMRNVQMSPYYNFGIAYSYPSNLDKWVINNGTGIRLGRADSFLISDVFIFAKHIGLHFAPSAYLVVPLGGYGTISNLCMDAMDIGIKAETTNVYGWDIANCQIACTGSTAPAKVAVQALTGASAGYEPRLRFHGGALFAATSYLTHLLGSISFNEMLFTTPSGAFFNIGGGAGIHFYVNNCEFMPGSAPVFGIAATMATFHCKGNRLNGNPTNLIPFTNIPTNSVIADNDFNIGLITAPAVPASTTLLTNTSGMTCRVYISGGTVTSVSINGTATGLILGEFTLKPNENIAVTYSVVPTWKWFAV